MNSNYRELKDLQRVKYQELIDRRLPKAIAEAGCDVDEKFSIECSMFPVDTTNVVNDEGTEYYPIRMECKVNNLVSGETATFNVDVINLPVLYELGFKVQGNYVQMLDSYERASGWSFLDNSKGTAKPSITASVLAQYGKTFSFVYDEMRDPYVMFSRKGKKHKLTVSTFFRALTGMSNNELLSVFGTTNPFVITAFTQRHNSRNNFAKEASNSKNVNDCIDLLANAMLGEERARSLSTIQLKKREIEQNLYVRSYFNLGDGNLQRFNREQSYAHRATGKELAQSISTPEGKFEAGTIVTEEIGEVLDALPIRSLKVKHNGKLFDLKKFTTFTFNCLGWIAEETIEEAGVKAGDVLTLEQIRDLNATEREQVKVRRDSSSPVESCTRRTSAASLTLEDIFTAFSMWMDNLNGYGLYDNQFDLGNRVSVAFDDRVYNHVVARVDSVVKEVSNLVRRYDVEEPLLLTIADLKLSDHKNDFIQELRNTESKDSQMSDMCNIVSYISKSNKLTTDIKSTRATDDMRNVQLTQEGRLDPFDSPESAKIGLVHHKTLLADTNENGDLVTPYLKVKNGKVVSEEPVYLSSIEEDGKYIAMWNETFQEDDGSPKKRILARFNGDHVTVEMEKVSYKEYSPIQSMSVNHSMISLANHSNGKRIIMSCNEQNQALVTVNNAERPLLGTGCESLVDFGNYKAKDVLKQYYESGVQMYPEFESKKEEILNSPLRLDSINRSSDTRTLNFTVLAMEGHEYSSASLTIPYMLKNFNDAAFSFKVAHAKNHTYQPDDVVAYYQGYSLEKQEREDLVDFGALKVDDKTFDKGLAMGRNLFVGYKTFGASTIEDALSISDRLIYDDTLTHLRLVMIKSTLYNGKGKTEMFGFPHATAESIFNSNGLPKRGTKLKPGDKCIAKTVVRDGGTKVTVKYERVKANVEGQVIASEIIEKNGKTEAHVLVASRAPIENGDKMAGRHGNKGTIARIVPEDEMPFDPVSGRSLDICLNPLGVPSRQNVSQILEVAITMCRMIDGKATNISPYNPDDLNFIKEQCKKFDVHPIKMIDGRTGEYFKRTINVGSLYMFKLHHVAANKIHAIGLDAPVDPTFLQPKKGSKNEGGQSFGEMENWCLHGVGANSVLNDFYGLQSDDLESRDNLNNRILGRPALDVDKYNNNSNDATMIAMLRSLGSELFYDEVYNSYELKPLTDERIKALSYRSVLTSDGLHNPYIFGNDEVLKERPKNKSKWGWIDLNTKFVHPTWIYKGVFAKYVIIEPFGKDSVTFSKDVALEIIRGNIYIDKVPCEGGTFRAFVMSDVNADDEVRDAYESAKEHLVTGMDAVVFLVESIDMDKIQRKAEAVVAKLDTDGIAHTDEKYMDAIVYLSKVREFNESGCKPSDYVTTSFPVMPQNFRAKIEVSGRGNSIPDFDYYYTQILNAAKKIKETQDVTSKAQLFKAVSDFVGYDNKDPKYKSVLMYFGGKDKEDGNDKHGKLRSAIQSKRIFCSGRAVISPARYRIKPTELGVPAIMLVKMAQSYLIAYFTSKAAFSNAPKTEEWAKLFLQLAVGNFDRFKDVYEKSSGGFREMFDNRDAHKAYHDMRRWIVEYFENTKNPDGTEREDRLVVLDGRQPSLHKYSIRAFHVVVLWTKAIELSPLLCTGFNADFDGDQMWVSLLLDEEARNEAIQKMSPGVDFINPKNGSIMLKHTQDISLGCYVGTMLKDNVEQYPYTANDIHYYTSLESIDHDVFEGELEPYDLVCYNPAIDHESGCYLSTAGRILFNAIFDDGLTDEPFTNTLGVQGINPERYKELKYDALITSGKAGSGPIRYLNLQDICMERYMEDGDHCIDSYYDIEVYGFRFSDLYSVTISYEDLDIDSNRDELLEEMAQKKSLIEQDYQNGLIAAEDKKNAMINLYKNDKDGIGIAIEKDLINHLSRNNNLFIMMDSGARGNKSQIMQMCGCIGVLSKNNSENMENPVTNNYFKGLTDFDVHSTSYSARTGMASTQMESRNAGYATRRVVYMTDGTTITESDCGKTDWWYDVQWGDLRRDLIRFYPSKKWFDKNLLGKAMTAWDGQEDSRTVEETDFAEFVHKGFNTVTVDGGTIVAEPDMLINAILDPEDAEAQKLFGQLLSNGRFGSHCLTAFNHYKVMELKTSYGKIVCRYKIDNCSRSQLYLREARELPFLKTVTDSETGDSMSVITKETLNAIEEQGLSRIEARILLDCECKHGICAHCYGLKYSNLKIPKVGEVVGTESAQSIGEPAAQLTMDVVNKGGASNAALTSGLDIFSSYLNGTIIGGKKAKTADVPEYSGYVRVSKMGDSVSVAVEPIDKDCEMCRLCQYKNQSAGKKGCPLEMSNRGIDPMCLAPERIQSSSLLVQDGEWVKSGYPITDFPLISNGIVSVDDSRDPRVVIRRKQMIWVNNYYDVFHNQSIEINARHFEILALAQNQNAIVTQSSNPSFKVGNVYKLNELRNSGALTDGSVEYHCKTSSLSETILSNSGLLTALTFANQSEVVSRVTTSNLKSSCEWNTSPVGKISAGQPLDSSKGKEFNNETIVLSDDEEKTTINFEPEIVEVETPLTNGLDITAGMDSFNLDAEDLFGDLDFEGMTEAEPEVQPEAETEVQPTTGILDAFGSTESEPVKELEPVKEPAVKEPAVLAYRVVYFFDGTEISAFESTGHGEPGTIVTPQEEMIPDGYHLASVDQIELVSDNQLIQFMYESGSEESDSTEEPEDFDDFNGDFDENDEDFDDGSYGTDDGTSSMSGF